MDSEEYGNVASYQLGARILQSSLLHPMEYLRYVIDTTLPSDRAADEINTRCGVG